MVLGISIHQIPLRISSKQSSDTRRQNGERYTILGSWWCNTSDPQVKTFTNRPSVSWSRSYCSLMIYWKGNKKWLKEEKYTQNKRKKKTWGRGKRNNFNSQAFQQPQKLKAGCSWRWHCHVPLSIAPKILVPKWDRIWKYTGCLFCNYAVSQAIKPALHFYLSHKKQVLISHGKTVT